MPSDQPAAPIGSGRLRLIVFILVGLFLLLRLFAGAWAEWSWFGSVGFTDVWWTLVGNSAFLVVVTAIAAITLLWGNIALAARLSPGIVMVPDEDGQRPLAVWMQPRVRRLFVLMAVAFGVLNGFGATAWTQHFLYFRNAQDFGTNDPVFGLDVGFYIFQLPFIQDLLGWS
ncbi:MAG: UPF0182 family protein, partial [Acidimicrobiia bacterium]